jgi:hypothetical protein
VNVRGLSGMQPAAVLFVGVLSGSSAFDVHAAPDCPAGLFGVVAQIVRVDPPGTMLSKRLVSGRDEPVGTNGVICAGESLDVSDKGGLRSVEVYTGGRKEVLKPDVRFQRERGLLAHTASALNFLSDLIGGVAAIKPPPSVPVPTAVRGAESTAPAATVVRALRGLREPQQKLVMGLAPVLGWRGGSGPYRCLALSDAAEEVASAVQPGTASWCAIEGDVSRAALLQVRDDFGKRESWNVTFVEEADVPRPAWLGSTQRLAHADRTAWAVWLWKDAGPEWRLTALAMLHRLAPVEWVAGYARDSLLSESDTFAPR